MFARINLSSAMLHFAQIIMHNGFAGMAFTFILFYFPSLAPLAAPRAMINRISRQAGRSGSSKRDFLLRSICGIHLAIATAAKYRCRKQKKGSAEKWNGTHSRGAAEKNIDPNLNAHKCCTMTLPVFVRAKLILLSIQPPARAGSIRGTKREA